MSKKLKRMKMVTKTVIRFLPDSSATKNYYANRVLRLVGIKKAFKLLSNMQKIYL